MDIILERNILERALSDRVLERPMLGIRCRQGSNRYHFESRGNIRSRPDDIYDVVQQSFFSQIMIYDVVQQSPFGYKFFCLTEFVSEGTTRWTQDIDRLFLRGGVGRRR